MKFDNEKIKEFLTKEDYISEEDIKAAYDYAAEHNSSIVEYLLSKKIITKTLLGQAIAEHFEISYIDLKLKEPTPEQVLRLPEDISKEFNIVLFKEEDDQIFFACDDPSKKRALAEKISETLSIEKEILFAFAFTEDIQSCFIHYRKPLETRFNEIIQKQTKVAPEIIYEIIKDALIYRASDIHLEPQEADVIIRLRIDGILQEAGKLPMELYQSILNRIKVQSHIRIDEHFSAQDGAMRVNLNDKFTDLRISIIPTLDGEKIVIRILSEYVKQLGLSDLGLSVKDQELITTAAKKPFGMILSTGPTGSGKTTTLYSVLKMLNKPEVNITTIEDPVEFKVKGINQIQVNNLTGLTFAKGLRSIVRQDPNIILVGEIRDEETAEIAVNAALTGHLLLSSFHANDAATAITRLSEMNVEPFLLASTLNLIVSQRLIRKICANCRYSREYEIAEIRNIIKNADQYFPHEVITLYSGKGCSSCNMTGYKERVALFETIYITEEMQDLILQNPSMGQIKDLARTQGAHSFFEDGIEKVKNGITSLEELMRVAPSSLTFSKNYDEN